MKNTLLAIAAIIGLSGPASAQLIVAPIPTDSLALSLQADPTLLSHLTANTLSFESGGVLWEQQANFSLGSFIIGNGTEGGFYADVSFLGRESLRPNHFGVTDEGLGFENGGTVLFNDYVAPDDFATSFRITANDYRAADFWFYADKEGQQVTYFHDHVNVRTWTAFDSDAGLLHVLFGWDDQNGVPVGVDDNDYDDGGFKVTFNIDPTALDVTPVPEPSTYALWGGAMLVAAVAYRRRFGSQSISVM